MVASIKKRSKNTCRFCTPFFAGSLCDAFVGMPCFGSIMEVVDGNEPFAMIRPGVEDAEQVDIFYPTKDVVLEAAKPLHCPDS